MSEEYIEKKTARGFVIRVNVRRGTFILLDLSGEPVSVSRGSHISQIHPLVHVVFLGQDFDFSDTEIDRVSFFYLDRSYLKIPFGKAGMSDVRLIRIPVPMFESDMLPAYVIHFKSHWPGPLPPVGEGMRYFVADEFIDRETIVRIKTKFPLSRVIVYRPEEAEPVRLENMSDHKAGKKTVRAADFVPGADVVQYAQNPVFAARVFLRQLDWNRIYSLPLYGRVRVEEVGIILDFVQTMLTKSQKSKELSVHQQTLRELEVYWQGLEVLFKRDISALRRWRNEVLVRHESLLDKFVLAVEAQANFYDMAGIVKDAHFLGDAVHAVRESVRRVEDSRDDDIKRGLY